MISRTLFVLHFTATVLASSWATASNHLVPSNALKLSTHELSAAQPSPLLTRIIGIENQNASSSLSRQSRALERLVKILNQAEKEQSQARFLGLNRGGRFRGLLVVWLPVSFVLPTLRRHKHHGGYQRSLDAEQQQEEDPLQENDIDYDPSLADYQFDDNYGPLLSRLDAYFSLLGIDQLPCRTLLLCHASQDAATFQPLSNLFNKLMERSQAFSRPTHYHAALRRFFTYYWAAKKGRSYHPDAGQCDQEYSTCPWKVPEMIRLDMLRFWQGLSQRFAIQLEDE